MELDRLVILDFEATCDDKPMDLPQKIIEFPAIVLCAKTGQRIGTSEFHEYVNPNQTLSTFCHELTGITQEQVDMGDPIKTVFQRHVKWLYEQDLDPYYVNVHPRWAYVTCGDWDFQTCFPNESIDGVPCTRRWINIKKPFKTITGQRGGGMKKMLSILGLSLDGRHHSGIDDTRNTAKIASMLISKGWKPHESDLTTVHDV